jgi:hypothetical protein
VSVAGDVAGAVAAAVEGLALAGVTVVRRKTPSLPHGASPPQAVVCVGEEGEDDYLTARLRRVRYPVVVALVTAAGAALGDDDAFRDWRERVRDAVDRKGAFAAVPEFDAVSHTGRVPFDQAALRQDLNYGFQVFTVETIEPRS